ncbi:MAG: 2-amino-4-hydroxy-6-hydroxymethyldihydropteridine diphosphokinase, partial [Duncaniella sp.]|nr:2-amino-4-hydroxy-6-hydroxymethyldihydropteridine diphosphokinase [Duncaniella sp.]
MTVHINIGSNLGEREATLRRATDLIIRAFPGTAHISHPYESCAWGYESDNTYLNVGVSIALDKPQNPIEILHTLQSIERTIDDHP